MIRPSGGVGWRESVEMICPTGEAKYFCKGDSTEKCPTGKSVDPTGDFSSVVIPFRLATRCESRTWKSQRVRPLVRRGVYHRAGRAASRTGKRNQDPSPEVSRLPIYSGVIS